MATINKPKKKTRYKINNKAKDIYDNVYNTTTWRNLRYYHLLQHPLCERCMKDLAIEVHHIKHISEGNSIEEYQKIGFDDTNLMSVCAECHKVLHGKEEKK